MVSLYFFVSRGSIRPLFLLKIQVQAHVLSRLLGETYPMIFSAPECMFPASCFRTKSLSIDRVPVHNFLRGRRNEAAKCKYSRRSPPQISTAALTIKRRYNYYTVSRKKRSPLNISKYLHQILTDFRNSFTVTISRKFAIKRSLNIPPHLTRVATLPCEKLMSENYLIREIRHIISLYKIEI